MNPLIAFFNTILYQPLFNILVLLYQYLPGQDFGVAVIVLTILVRFLIHPLGAQAIKSQRAMSELQPKLQQIKEKHKGDKAAEARASMELYRKAKINPFSGCLPLLVQLPIMIALFLVLRRMFLPETMTHLYSFVPNPGQLNPKFLGLLDLSKASPVLAVLAGIGQFFQSKITMGVQKIRKSENQKIRSKPGDFSQIIQKQMLYVLPVITVLIVWRLPSAIGLYWLVTSLFSIGEQYLVLRPKSKNHAQSNSSQPD